MIVASNNEINPLRKYKHLPESMKRISNVELSRNGISYSKQEITHDPVLNNLYWKAHHGFGITEQLSKAINKENGTLKIKADNNNSISIDVFNISTELYEKLFGTK